MPTTQPKQWIRASGRTLADLAKDLSLTPRSLLRYLKGDRLWPHKVVVDLKRISGGALSDESFNSSRTSQKSSRIRGKHRETIRSLSSE